MPIECSKCHKRAVFVTVRKDTTGLVFLCLQHFTDLVTEVEFPSVRTMRQYIQDTRAAPPPAGWCI